MVLGALGSDLSGFSYTVTLGRFLSEPQLLLLKPRERTLVILWISVQGLGEVSLSLDTSLIC